MEEKEIWKPVKGYEGLYEVSNLGRVRSIARTIYYSNGRIATITPVILTTFKVNKNKGSLAVALRQYGKKQRYKNISIYKLVQEAFLGYSTSTIRYIDNNPSNNSLYNLNWSNDTCSVCGALMTQKKFTKLMLNMCHSCSVKKKSKTKTLKLSDSYVKETLRQQGFTTKDITPEMLEVKRNIIKLKRLCKQSNN